MRYPFPSSAAFQRWDTHRRKTCVHCLLEIPGFHSIRIPLCLRLVTLRQAQHKMPDDAALYFRCTCFDRVPARPKIAVRPDAFIDRMTVIGKKLTIWPEDFLRDLLQPLVQCAPKHLLNGSFGPSVA